MLSDIDIGWLVGIFDGEGSVSITRQDTPSGPRYAVQLSIGGTDPLTRERVRELLLSLGVSKVYDYNQKTRDSTAHKPSWHVRVRKFPDALIVAERLMDYSTTKREHWRVVREFCMCRIRSGRKPYGEREHELWAESDALNRRGPR